MGTEYITNPQVFLSPITAINGVFGINNPFPLLTTYQYWVSTGTVNTSAFPIPGNWSMLDQPGSFIVTVGNVIQSPTDYTIDSTNRRLTFASIVTAGIEVGVTQLATAAPSSTNVNYIQAVSAAFVNLSAANAFITNSTTIGNTLTSNSFNLAPLTLLGAASGSVYLSLQNNYSNVSASTDISVYNNTGNYLDIGINSSGYDGNRYSPTFNIVGPGDSYVYSTANDLAIGTSSQGNNNDLIFFTGGSLSGTNITTGNERMRITNTAGTYAGNIGIGTSTPNKTLTIIGTLSCTNTINSSDGVLATSLSSRFINLEHTVPNDGINPVLFIGERGDGSGGTVLNSLSGFNITYDEVNNKLITSTSFGSLTPLTATTVDLSGNFGIGTDKPNTKLTVVGDISATGVIFSQLGAPVSIAVPIDYRSTVGARVTALTVPTNYKFVANDNIIFTIERSEGPGGSTKATGQPILRLCRNGSVGDKDTLMRQISAGPSTGGDVTKYSPLSAGYMFTQSPTQRGYTSNIVSNPTYYAVAGDIVHLQFESQGYTEYTFLTGKAIVSGTLFQ